MPTVDGVSSGMATKCRNADDSGAPSSTGRFLNFGFELTARVAAESRFGPEVADDCVSVAIGKAGAVNAAILAVQMLALSDANLRRKQ